MPVNQAEQDFFKYLATLAEENPAKPFNEMSIEEFRAGGALFDDPQLTGQPSDVSSHNEHVPARDGHQIPVRVYNDKLPADSKVLVFYPGCGYVHELFEANALACSRIAKLANCKVIVVDFRLAPEHPMPKSVEDGYDAAKYIFEHHEHFGFNPEYFYVGGISSGGHCAAVVSNLNRKDHAMKIRRQFLMNGCYQMTGATHDFGKQEEQDLMCTRSSGLLDVIVDYWRVDQSSLTDPMISPYYDADLSGQPNTTFLIAEFDGIRSDSEAYYKKLSAVNSNIDRVLLAGQTHNTFILRKAMSDGIDPAQVIADSILSD